MSIIAPLLIVASSLTAGSPSTPADGLRLDTDRPVVSQVRLPQGGSPTGSRTPVLPVGFGGVALVGVAAVSAVAYTKRREDPLIVLVHGHGGSAEDFSELIRGLDVPADRVVSFDYGTAMAGADSTEASRMVSAADAAVELDALLRDLAEENANIYTIHHSKGGAVGVEVIAALDDGTRPMIDGYRGAALLDPAIGSGFVGSLQSLGEELDFVPDNGDFDPIRCDAAGCRDIREHLGEASGVEVIAIKNPDALVTNFTDQPEGLRTYDLVDDGLPSAWLYAWHPTEFAARVREAHGSVLHSDAVTSCVNDEIERPGSCIWTGDGFDPWQYQLGGGGSHGMHPM